MTKFLVGLEKFLHSLTHSFCRHIVKTFTFLYLFLKQQKVLHLFCQHPTRAEDLRRRFSALFFERAKENPDIKIVVVWPGQYRSEAFLCDPTVALEKIR